MRWSCRGEARGWCLLSNGGFAGAARLSPTRISVGKRRAKLDKPFVSRGFVGKRRDAQLASRIPPGQYLTADFPVLSAGPTPRTPLERWSFSIEGLVGKPTRWTWEAFRKLPVE